ncbi:hypothetical protein A5789_06740 [Nocardia sp. 852002-51101_SCH5132738]|uniref:hypothetical protein n=1 Tax=Nocardia TaxID=1817 RepID=UPI0007EB7014|nr:MULTISPECIES: hypothetical protein [Nocardia]MBF6272058.1 hypothetical protein [Nocardia nova]OBA45473.1 hypothetical protein A5789_06740 [Nocardia sp. 852002-51101_SCH5132738]OBF80929.1 hypothetical protein A9X06_20540 [Mycobacterium sp. 852002-51759_SCH5129042]
MMFSLTALLVWMAASARIGRVLVKPPTTARMAIVIAVAAVGAAATLGVPETAVAVDHSRPQGINGQALADRLVAATWMLFAVATSVVAAAAWPVVSRRNLRQIAWAVYGFGAFLIAATIGWSILFGWAMTLLGCVFIAVTGLRNLDWTALGRGIALYTAGTMATGVLAALSIRRLTVGAQPVPPGEPGWFWPGWQLASLLIAGGAVWIVIERWMRARLLLRQIRALHRTMIKRFPEVVAHEQTVSVTELKASDQVAQIMDALYLQTGGGMELAAAGVPARSVTERAERVARWARNPLGDEIVDARWIAPPEGLSPRGWVQAIARAFERTAVDRKSAVAQAD